MGMYRESTRVVEESPFFLYTLFSVFYFWFNFFQKIQIRNIRKRIFIVVFIVIIFVFIVVFIFVFILFLFLLLFLFIFSSCCFFNTLFICFHLFFSLFFNFSLFCFIDNTFISILSLIQESLEYSSIFINFVNFLSGLTRKSLSLFFTLFFLVFFPIIIVIFRIMNLTMNKTWRTAN